jgi:hypothetical protein
MSKTFAFVALTLLLAACSVSAAPTPTPTSTETPTPSATPPPTLTPTLAATSTPEPPTATATSPEPAAGDLECSVLWQSIRNGHHFGSRERFDMSWQVRNTGTLAWDPATVDFTYLAGTRMFLSDTTQLKRTVEPGDTVALVADMVAPRSTGGYTTVWTLRRGTFGFCQVNLRIIVP